MIVTYLGTRGSITTNAKDTAYGGNTPSVLVQEGNDMLIFDAGSGIRRIGDQLIEDLPPVIHLLLTHLHMDHIQGLGFFKPFYHPGATVHLWGPSGSSSLAKRLNRYLSPPLFPVRLRDFSCNLVLHEVPMKPFEIGAFRIKGTYICHPGPTLGYRVSGQHATMTYIPDHEPALGVRDYPLAAEWTSGYDLAKDTDLLIHDAQFSHEEYQTRQGWGHSSYQHALKFAELTRAKKLALFHHDPTHDDHELERLYERCQPDAPCEIQLATEEQIVELG